METSTAGYAEVHTTAGFGSGIWWRGLPRETEMDKRDTPSGIIELVTPQGSLGMPGVIAPRKAVNEVLKLLEDTTQEVLIEISTAKARFSERNSSTVAQRPTPCPGSVTLSPLTPGRRGLSTTAIRRYN